MVIKMNDFLAHHGIIGQKWGIRRYQYQDGSLTPEGYKHYGYGSSRRNDSVTLPSDVVYRRITDDPNARVAQGAFITYQPKDSEAYRGLFGMTNVQKMSLNSNVLDRFKPQNDDGKVYELSFKANKLTIPSKEARLNTFAEFIKDRDNKRDVQKEILDQGRLKKIDMNNHNNLDKAYLYFNECLGRPAEENPVNKRYFDFMTKKGYDAIVDENDVRLSKTIRANAPLIIINPNAVTDTSIKLKALTPADIVPAAKKNTWSQYLKIIKNQNEEILEPMRAGKDAVDNATTKFSKDYTLKDLSKDRYVNNMSFKKIEKLNAVMIEEGLTRQEAAAKLGYKINI